MSYRVLTAVEGMTNRDKYSLLSPWAQWFFMREREKKMSWIYLITAGIFEMGFTTSLKLTDGFTKITPTIFFFIFALLSFWFLNKAIETIPLGIAYAVWTGIGAAGTACIGIFFFEEQLTLWKMFFIGNLIFSIFGLKFLS